MPTLFSRARITRRSFHVFHVMRLSGWKMGGWYERMRSAFFCSASSITSSVRSLVKKRVLTVWGGLGSTRRPTLSQLSAREREAKSFREETKTFRSMRARKGKRTQGGPRRRCRGIRFKQDGCMRISKGSRSEGHN